MTEQDGGCPVSRAMTSAAEKIAAVVVVGRGQERNTQVWDLSRVQESLFDSTERLFSKQAVGGLVVNSLVENPKLTMIRLTNGGANKSDKDAIFVKMGVGDNMQIYKISADKDEAVRYNNAANYINVQAAEESMPGVYRAMKNVESNMVANLPETEKMGMRENKGGLKK